MLRYSHRNSAISEDHLLFPITLHYKSSKTVNLLPWSCNGKNTVDQCSDIVISFCISQHLFCTVEVPREILKTCKKPFHANLTLLAGLLTQQCLQISSPSSPSVALGNSYFSSPDNLSLCKIRSPITNPSYGIKLNVKYRYEITTADRA